MSKDDFEILDRGYSNTLNRKLAEALFIKELKPKLNEQVKSYKLNLFNWFNGSRGLCDIWRHMFANFNTRVSWLYVSNELYFFSWSLAWSWQQFAVEILSIKVTMLVLTHLLVLGFLYKVLSRKPLFITYRKKCWGKVNCALEEWYL